MTSFKMVVMFQLLLISCFTEFKTFESAAKSLQSKFLLGFVTGDTGRAL